MALEDGKNMQVRLSDYPQLKLIGWNRLGDDLIDEAEALALYERNWRFIDEASLDATERSFIQRLVKTYGNGVLDV